MCSPCLQTSVQLRKGGGNIIWEVKYSNFVLKKTIPDLSLYNCQLFRNYGINTL